MISSEKKLLLRRRRVARRLAKRWPLFVVEMMQEEFPGYGEEELIEDMETKKRGYKSKRRPKSPMKRQGRYPLYEKALMKYHTTGDLDDLYQAQFWRNRLFLPYEVEFHLDGKVKTYTFPSTMSVDMIYQLGKIKGFSSWEELDKILEEKLKYSTLK